MTMHGSRHDREGMRMLKTLKALVVAVLAIPLVVLSMGPATAIDPTACTTGGSPPAKACKFTHVGLEWGNFDGTGHWYYPSSKNQLAQTGHVGGKLYDTQADGDCVLLRVVWIAAQGDTPTSDNIWPAGKACGAGTFVGIDKVFGTGLDGTANDSGYYRVDICRDDSGTVSACNKIWLQSVANSAP
jgi:hypothetical protein